MTFDMTTPSRAMAALRCPLWLLLLAPTAALAHVKWFEEYEVAQKPVPVATTLSLPYFWVGIALVLVLFIATTLLERRAPGVAATRGLDMVTRPLREHADNFLIAILFAFFVALFAVGGTYLTPELKTDSELLPWVQLVIGVLVIPRRTRPLAAVAIVLLWLVTMRDYDLFHLYDYLALGLGLAGYLLLSGLKDGPWHDRRFAVLRWGIALALMWSSMEKFMYPQWFLPLLEEKPFLAFGIAFGPYTTMAGVAEFTLGFGLLWTPLVRRLSAAMLFLLMFSAVYPFGRVDMIGHASDAVEAGGHLFNNTRYTNVPAGVLTRTAYYKYTTDFQAYHSASVRYKHDDWTLQVGVNNLFDKGPPEINTGEFRVGTAMLNGYDMRGRRGFVRVGKSF
jgi:hypothetical protein